MNFMIKLSTYKHYLKIKTNNPAATTKQGSSERI